MKAKNNVKKLTHHPLAGYTIRLLFRILIPMLTITGVLFAFLAHYTTHTHVLGRDCLSARAVVIDSKKQRQELKSNLLRFRTFTGSQPSFDLAYMGSQLTVIHIR